ncbi:hypothetical protein ACF0H5_024000 [Mactra antiquata]
MFYTVIFWTLLLFGVSAGLHFETLSTVYLPFTYTPTPQYELDKDAAEQMSYDSKNHILYSVGYTNIHVIDVHNLTQPVVLHHSSYPNVDATDVEVCGDFVYVAYDNKTTREHGYIDVYKVYNKTTGTLDLVHKIIVGDIPDMVHPTSDCKKLVVAIEAEPYIDDINNKLIDNAGGVIILTFTGDGQYTLTNLTFDKFNSRFEELSQSGVRWIYRGNNNTFANDIEPEYITFNTDESKAYICLQENNAIAVVNMETNDIEEILGLGYKHWTEFNSDVSDKDGGVAMKTWPIYGMYQPDSIKFYRHHGVDYIILANEGDSKDYPPYFSEENRVDDLTLSNMFEPNVTIRNELMEREKLGRLTVTNVNGKNETYGEYDRLYSFGGRSFTIRRVDNMEIVYDSGDELERMTSLLQHELFNNDVKPSKTVIDTMDSRSDNKGPETESITMGHVNGVTLLMIGNERPGTIAVYSIDEKLPTPQPVFETMIHGISKTNDTWENLYSNADVSMLDPEDIRFVPGPESPNKKPLLLVSGSVSGTVTILQVHVDVTEDEGQFFNHSNAVTSNILFIVTMLILTIFNTSY